MHVYLVSLSSDICCKHYITPTKLRVFKSKLIEIGRGDLY